MGPGLLTLVREGATIWSYIMQGPGKGGGGLPCVNPGIIRVRQELGMRRGSRSEGLTAGPQMIPSFPICTEYIGCWRLTLAPNKTKSHSTFLGRVRGTGMLTGARITKLKLITGQN